MQSRNDSVKTSKARRFLHGAALARGGRRGNQRELHARRADAHAIAGTHRGAFAHARAIDPGAVAAVIDEHRALAFAAQRAMAARHARGRARQRDVRRVGDFFGADRQPDFRETHGVAAEEDVRDRQRARRRGC